jgi:formamidopyrimidine-DNA glycosylase
MDQRVVVGVGNIYASEALFRRAFTRDVQPVA